jgi:AcrR family transcriptional regulator
MHNVNDRLYPARRADVNESDQVAAIFANAFAEQRDLAGLTPAAKRVLARSAALFFRQGAANVSVRDLTRACGLSPGALYNHFPSKDELLFTIVRHGHERMRRRLDTALAAADGGPEAGLSAFVGAYVAGHVDQPELAQLVRHEYLHLSRPHYTEIVAMRREIRRTLTDFLRAGAAAKVFDPIGDPISQALMVLDMCSRTSEWFDRTRDTDPDEIARRYVRAALRLVGANGG